MKGPGPGDEAETGPAPSGAIAVEYDPFAEGELTAAMTPTAPQQELWVASKAGGDDANRAFNEVLALTLRGALSPEALEAAVRVLTERHDCLRCSFTPDGQRFTVASAAETSVGRIDLSAEAPEARERELGARLRREVEVAFDLERPPLYRASLIRLEPERHVFVFCAHHSICDGWSTGVLAHELGALYRAFAGGAASSAAAVEAAGLPPAPSFAAFATDQRAREGTDAGKREEAFWLERLAGELKPIDLPLDRPRPARRTYGANRLDLSFDPALLAPLRKLGAKAGCTFLSTFLGAAQVWLSRVTGQRDLVVAVPAAGQAAAGVEALVGHCVNVLPVRAGVDPSASFLAHLGALKPRVLDAFDNQQVTFSSLLRRLDVAFDPSRIPLVPVCVNVESGLGALDFGGLEVSYATVPRAFETFELFINAVDHRDRLVLEWSYNTALFDEATIRRWMRQLETIVAAVIARPDTALKDLGLLSPEDQEILARLETNKRPLEGSAVHERVAAQARERPGAAAVLFAGRTLTYGDLDRRATELAARLGREGVRPGDAVGVFLNRSERLPVALLAVLKTGAAYVPMDPNYPAERLAMMVEDAGVRLVVTATGLLSGLPPGPAPLCLDQIEAALGAEPVLSTLVPAVPVAGGDRAYVLFTSGSTGRPKGVEIPHRALENFLASMQREPGFSAGDRLLAVTTVSFDIAGLELFLPLVSGGTIVLADGAQASDPEALASLLERHDVTVMQATPATWRMLIDTGWKGRPRLRALCGGEALAPALAAELAPRVGELWNMYGPTETTIWSTVKKIARGGRVSIGRPIDNTSVYVLDPEGGRVPVGATGEIWIGGDGVALGYRGRPDLTAERFVDDPYVLGDRMYRTGDLGRVLADGDIECLGRGDSQIKLRGFRIELAEIEAALERFAGVRKSVVKLVEKGQAPQLVAYWVADPSAAVDEAALKAHLQRLLPPYMLPQHYVAMDKWPMTPAGKIDRKALPEPKAQRAAGAQDFRDDVDVAVAEIWEELLGVKDLGLDDDFFALGGQSLLAVRFVARVKDRLGVPFRLATLFGASTLREVADAIRGGGGQLERGAVLLRREPGATRVFFVCGVQLYRATAQSLGPGFEGYGVIVLADELMEEALRRRVAPKVDMPQLLAEYMEAIRRVQPQGPYHLAGVSFGGVLAYELARQLRAAGEPVGLLALLDPILPSAVQKDRFKQIQQHLNAEGLLSLGAKVAKKLRGAGAAPGAAGPQGPTDEIDAARLGEMRNQAYEDAMASWDPVAMPYEGDAVLFRATDTSQYGSLTIAPDLGWRRLVRGRLSIHDISGSHIGMLQPHNAVRLADVMRQHLRALDRPPARDEAQQPPPAI
jgi:amino acid adenylation domain-containing protein